MSETLEQLCSRVQTLRARWDKVPWCTLSIELKAISRQGRCYVGVALIDRRLLGHLINGEPRSFRVEPGEHTVTVYLARAARFGEVEKNVISLQVNMRPRENVRLVGGRSNQMSAAKKAFQTGQTRLVGANLAGSVLLAGLSWLIFPFLREVVAHVTHTLSPGDPWLSLCYWPVRSRAITVICVCFGWTTLLNIIFHERYRRWTQSAPFRLWEPYFLAKVASSASVNKTT